MATAVTQDDVWEVEEALSAAVTQASVYAQYHIEGGVHRLSFVRDISYIMADIVEQFESQALLKEEALALIHHEHQLFFEQHQQVAGYGAEFIADAMFSVSLNHEFDSAHLLCIAAESAQYDPIAELSTGEVGTDWQYSANARRFLLFNYVAQDQLQKRLEAYLNSDEVRERSLQRYYQHIIDTSPVVMTPVVEQLRKPLTLQERVAKQRWENYRAGEEAYARSRSRTMENIPPKVPAQETSITDSVVGGLKQLANDFLGSHRALLAEHLEEKNVFK